MTRTKQTLTILALSVLVLGSVAAPALAREHEDRPGPDDRRAEAEERRAAHQQEKAAHHIAQRCRDAANETGEVPEACRRAAVAMGALARCRAAAGDDNASDLPASCDRLLEVHDGEHKARRAAHAILKAVDALEHRMARLEIKEIQIQHRIDEGNLTDENLTRAQEHLEKIQDAQDRAAQRILHLEARLEAIKERWHDAREHADAYKAKRGHSDESEHDHDHDDDGEDADEAADADEAPDGNQTADPDA